MRVFGRIDAGLRRLFKDEGGNTFVIVAAAVIPLMGVVGGGLDLARAHLAKSRLSQACDAAALAGRRAMVNDDLETAKPEATKFFNYNFPQGYMETAAFTPVVTKPERGTITIQASTTVPTTIMKIFKAQTLPIEVTCQATQNFDNIDIVLVLDVTGSMDDSISGKRKIESLQDAVMSLYRELASAQTELTNQGLRLRYGIVPYSSTVNVGKLVRAVNTGYMANNWVYQSRTRYSNSSGTWNVYEPKTVNVATYLTGTAVNANTVVGGSDKWSTWNGCIEERKTTSTITASSGTSPSDIPAGANDLNIDLVPTSSDDTKWGPQWDPMVYRTDGSGVSNWCPAQARRLGVMTESEMQTYVNTLTPAGPTYHDIGMIWGARFISRGGIFGADNPLTFNSRKTNRYVIFLTDGDLAPSPDNGAAYGVEYLDRRVAGGTYNTSLSGGNGSDLEQRHTVRFLMACNAAKQGGASIYTIAFGLSIPSSLQECASSPDQASVTDDGTELDAKFKEIGRNIGALRLKQ